MSKASRRLRGNSQTTRLATTKTATPAISPADYKALQAAWAAQQREIEKLRRLIFDHESLALDIRDGAAAILEYAIGGVEATKGDSCWVGLNWMAGHLNGTAKTIHATNEAMHEAMSAVRRAAVNALPSHMVTLALEPGGEP
jgi:hypothetical protein